MIFLIQDVFWGQKKWPFRFSMTILQPFYFRSIICSKPIGIRFKTCIFDEIFHSILEKLKEWTNIHF